MKIPVIKKICETYSIEQLQAAEAALMEEQAPEIEIEGSDEGEKLTHVLAAIWCLEDIKANNTNIAQAVRNYTVKVRNSIG